MPLLLSPLFQALLQFILALNGWLQSLVKKRRQFDLERDGAKVSPFPCLDAYSEFDVINIGQPNDAHISRASRKPRTLPSRQSSSAPSTASVIVCHTTPASGINEEDDEELLSFVMDRLKKSANAQKQKGDLNLVTSSSPYRTTPRPSSKVLHIVNNSESTISTTEEDTELASIFCGPSEAFDIDFVLNQLRQRHASEVTRRSFHNRFSTSSDSSLPSSLSLVCLRPAMPASCIRRSRSDAVLRFSMLRCNVPGAAVFEACDQLSRKVGSSNDKIDIISEDVKERRPSKQVTMVSPSGSIKRQSRLSNNEIGMRRMSHKWTVDTSRSLRKAIYPSVSNLQTQPLLGGLSISAFKFSASLSNASSLSQTSKSTLSFKLTNPTSSVGKINSGPAAMKEAVFQPAPDISASMTSFRFPSSKSETSWMRKTSIPTLAKTITSLSAQVSQKAKRAFAASEAPLASNGTSNGTSATPLARKCMSLPTNLPVNVTSSPIYEPPLLGDITPEDEFASSAAVDDVPEPIDVDTGSIVDEKLPSSDSSNILAQSASPFARYGLQVQSTPKSSMIPRRRPSSYQSPVSQISKRPRALSIIPELPSLVWDSPQSSAAKSISSNTSTLSTPRIGIDSHSDLEFSTPSSQLPYLLPTPSLSSLSIALKAISANSGPLHDIVSSRISHDQFIERLEERYRDMDWEDMVVFECEEDSQQVHESQRKTESVWASLCSGGAEEATLTPEKEWCDVFNLATYTEETV